MRTQEIEWLTCSNNSINNDEVSILEAGCPGCHNLSRDPRRSCPGKAVFCFLSLFSCQRPFGFDFVFHGKQKTENSTLVRAGPRWRAIWQAAQRPGPARAVRMARQKAGRSLGCREVMILPSTTTSSSR